MQEIVLVWMPIQPGKPVLLINLFQMDWKAFYREDQGGGGGGGRSKIKEIKDQGDQSKLSLAAMSFKVMTCKPDCQAR